MQFFIPETIKKYDNWLVWCKEWNDTRNKFEKIPYNPKTHKKALKTGICDYNTAFNVYQNMDEYQGLGFLFTKECNLTFIDIDHCIDDEGNENELAQELIEMFSDCFIELSQSEKGIHIICLGCVPKTLKTQEIEMYSCDRYIALTGNALCPNEPQEAQKRVNAIYNRFKPQEAENEPKKGIKGQLYNRVIDVDAIIEVIMNSKQGKKFECLHFGDWKEWNDPIYETQNQADQAYFNIVNYFTGGNDEKTIAIFEQSNLYDTIRRKTNVNYYIKLSLQAAKNSAMGSTSGTRKRQRQSNNICDGGTIYRKRRRINTN